MMSSQERQTERIVLASVAINTYSIYTILASSDGTLKIVTDCKNEELVGANKHAQGILGM